MGVRDESPSRTFRARLALVVAAGFAWRLLYVLRWKGDDDVLTDEGDALYYSAQAHLNARGHLFQHPLGGQGPAADHPPVTALVLTPVSWIESHLVLAQRLVMVVLGTAVIAVVGLLGRRVGGDRVGVLAAALAAVHAPLWANDGLLMAETPTALLVAALLWCAIEVYDDPSPRRLVLLGVLAGLATLTRAEQALLFGLLLVPLLVRGGAWWRDRLRPVVVAGLAAGLVVAPWVAWNLVRFEEPTLLSTNDGLTILGANCHTTYYTPAIGFWDLGCALSHPVEGDGSVQSAEWRAAGLRYLRDNAGRLPKVVAARVGRVWGIYRPDHMVWFNTGEGREPWVSWTAVYQHGALLPVAAAGAVVLRRRRRVLWPLLAPALSVTATAALFYGIVRFRVPADVAMVVLGAVAVDRALDRWWPSRRAAPG